MAAASAASTSQSKSGYDFGSFGRNSHLSHKGYPVPKATSTGTTLAGVIFDGGVVVGADTRASAGPLVADKDCEKIHYIAPHIRCCGAGTAADTEFVTANISSNIQLHELNTGRKAPVVAVLTMLKQYLFQYQGHVGAALILGGYDDEGPKLFSIAPHGSTDSTPFAALGSGSLAAMAVFESGFKEKLTRDEAIKLVSSAILAGIFNDLGSGSNVDICVIEKDKTEMMRHYMEPNARASKEQSYLFPPGVTGFTRQAVYDMVVQEDVLSVGASPAVAAAGGDKMDTSS